MSAALVAPHGPTRVNQRMPHSPTGRRTRSLTLPSPRAAWTMVVARLSIPAASASAGHEDVGDRAVDDLGLGVRRAPSRRGARRRRSACVPSTSRKGSLRVRHEARGSGDDQAQVAARADAVLRLRDLGLVRAVAAEGDEGLALCEAGKNLKVRACAHAVAAACVAGLSRTKAGRGRPAGATRRSSVSCDQFCLGIGGRIAQHERRGRLAPRGARRGGTARRAAARSR